MKAFTSSCRDKLYDGSSSVVTSNHIQPILRSLGWRGRIANYFQACRLHGSVFLLSLATQRHATRRWKRCPLNTLENYVFMSFAQCSVAPIAIAMKRCCRSDSYRKLSLSQRSAGGNSCISTEPVRQSGKCPRSSTATLCLNRQHNFAF